MNYESHWFSYAYQLARNAKVNKENYFHVEMELELLQ